MNRPVTQPPDLLDSQAVVEARAQLPHSEPPPLNDIGFTLPTPMRLTTTQSIAIILSVCVVGGVAFLVRWYPQQRAKLALAAEVDSRKDSLLRVQVVRPKPKASTKALVLPGSVQPLQECLSALP